MSVGKVVISVHNMLYATISVEVTYVNVSLGMREMEWTVYLQLQVYINTAVLQYNIVMVLFVY